MIQFLIHKLGISNFDLTTMTNNGTWNLVHLLAKKTIGCKWMNVMNVNPDESMARLKECLLAKGYAQTYGADYLDTFSLMAKLHSFNLCLSLLLIIGLYIN